jgi:hypothetical protein
MIAGQHASSYQTCKGTTAIMRKILRQVADAVPGASSCGPLCPGAAAPASVLHRQQHAVQGTTALQSETPAHEGGGPATAGYQMGFAH